MKKLLAIAALFVGFVAHSHSAQANGRHCFPVNLNGHHKIMCRDVPQQSRWNLDVMRRVNLHCTTVQTRFGPRSYCY